MGEGEGGSGGQSLTGRGGRTCFCMVTRYTHDTQRMVVQTDDGNGNISTCGRGTTPWFLSCRPGVCTAAAGAEGTGATGAATEGAAERRQGRRYAVAGRQSTD